MIGTPDSSAEVLRVTLDLGNSSLKAILWKAERVHARTAFVCSEPDLARRVVRWLDGFDPPRACALSSVAGRIATQAFAKDFDLSGYAPLCVHPDPGVANRCNHPETVGFDRLYAARGAIEQLPDGAVVLDAGTALTVDAVRGGEQGPEFLGGAIAPGPTLLIEALSRGGAQLHAVDPEPPVPTLGRETREALESGVVHGFRGAAAELSRGVGLESGLAGAPRVVTGGAAAWLLEPTPFWSGSLRHVPDLVHTGLRLA
ncbi:MAG: type III pantothenate kinase, partial [Planctomycetota bacterium]